MKKYTVADALIYKYNWKNEKLGYRWKKNYELNLLTIWDPLMIDFSFEIGEPNFIFLCIFRPI